MSDEFTALLPHFHLVEMGSQGGGNGVTKWWKWGPRAVKWLPRKKKRYNYE